MRFSILEYTPLNAPRLDQVVKILDRNTVRDRNIVDVAREVVTKTYSSKFEQWSEFYSTTIRAYPEDETVYIIGLRITPSQILDSKDRIESRIRIFDPPAKEPPLQARVVPMHCFWMLGENSIAISTEEPSVPQRNLRDWASKLAAAGGIEIAQASWGAMIKRFRSGNVNAFAESLRQDGIASFFDISCRTDEGELSFNSTLYRSDGTEERIDIRKTKTYEKLRRELEDPNNRKLVALECYPGTQDAFILSFPNLGRDQDRWTFTLTDAERDGWLDDRKTAKVLATVAHLFRRYRLSPPPPFTLNLESYDLEQKAS